MNYLEPLTETSREEGENTSSTPTAPGIGVKSPTLSVKQAQEEILNVGSQLVKLLWKLYCAYYIYLAWDRFIQTFPVAEYADWLMPFCEFSPDPLSRAVCTSIIMAIKSPELLYMVTKSVYGVSALYMGLVVLRGIALQSWAVIYLSWVTLYGVISLLGRFLSLFTMTTHAPAIQAAALAGVSLEGAIPGSKPIKIEGDLKRSPVIRLCRKDGFVLGHGFRVQNAAVFPRHELEMALASNGNSFEGLVLTNFNGTTKSPISGNWEVDPVGRGVDIVLLSVPEATWSVLGVQLGKIAKPTKNQNVYLMYADASGEKQLTQGRVLSSYRGIYFTHTASTVPGCSGTPVFYGANKIVGMHIGYDPLMQCNVALAMHTCIHPKSLDEGKLLVNRQAAPSLAPPSQISEESGVINPSKEAETLRDRIAALGNQIAVTLPSESTALCTEMARLSDQLHQVSTKIKLEGAVPKGPEADVKHETFLKERVARLSSGLAGKPLNELYLDSAEITSCLIELSELQMKMGKITLEAGYENMKAETNQEYDTEWEELGKQRQGFSRVKRDQTLHDSEMRTEDQGTRKLRDAFTDDRANLTLDQLRDMRNAGVTDWNDIEEFEPEGGVFGRKLKSKGLELESTKPGNNDSKSASVPATSILKKNGGSQTGSETTVVASALLGLNPSTTSTPAVDQPTSKQESLLELLKTPEGRKRVRENALKGDMQSVLALSQHKSQSIQDALVEMKKSAKQMATEHNKLKDTVDQLRKELKAARQTSSTQAEAKPKAEPKAKPKTKEPTSEEQ